MHANARTIARFPSMLSSSAEYQRRCARPGVSSPTPASTALNTAVISFRPSTTTSRESAKKFLL